MSDLCTNRMKFPILRLLKAAGPGLFATFAMSEMAYSAEKTVLEQMSPATIEALGKADVVILGEIHPNLEHRENQAALAAFVKPAAMVFEMIDVGQGPAFQDGYGAEGRAAFLARIKSGEFGWKSLDQYLSLLDAHPEARIMGAARPKTDVRRTVAEGAAAVFGDEAERFGLTTPLPKDQQETREALQMEAHCNALPEQMLSGMVEAQRFRDAVFAQRILQAQSDFGNPVVMITGNGHARNDWGIPAALAQAAPDLVVLSIGQFEETDAALPFAIQLKTAPFDEGDPCASFNK